MSMSRTPVAHSSDVMMEGIEPIDYKYAIIQENGSGDNEVVPLVASKRIKVVAYNFMSAGAVNAKWRSGTTDISGLSYMDAAGKGKVAPFNPGGWFRTAAGEALNLNLSGAVAVGGELVYVETT